MEVTRLNFPSVLEELNDVLKKATFLAIDGEFTGVNSGPDLKPYDTLSEYYEKINSSTKDFLLVQFGLSVFTYDMDSYKYTQRSYNFYIFPRPLSKSLPDCRFKCQASSMVFLADQGFDFNKLFKFGIPYLTTNEEQTAIKRVNLQRDWEGTPGNIPLSAKNESLMNEIFSLIDEFLKSDDDEFIIKNCNSFIKTLTEQGAQKRWPYKVRIEDKLDGALPSIVVYKIGSPEEEKKKTFERKKKEKNENQGGVGLTSLLQKISESEVLIVGHNMLLDLCHLTHQFFGKLPKEYSEFKKVIHGLFPKLIDTKILAQEPELVKYFRSSTLSNIFENVSKEPFKLPSIIEVKNRSYAMDRETYHEAGYDASITGLCFIAMVDYLDFRDGYYGQTEAALREYDLLNSLFNKLPIIRLKDYPYIDLDGTDPEPNRDHIYHLTFPKEWKKNNISKLFIQYGGINLSWLSDTTAYVELQQKDQARHVDEAIKNTGTIGNNCQIMTFKNFHA